MNILALDSADQVLSVALASNTGLWSMEIDAGARHSELLLESIDSLCTIAGFSRSELDMTACLKGPGSFTGLRIAYSAAKGISLALGIPLVALSTLDCLASPLSVWPGVVLPSIDAKKGCFYTAFYRGTARISDYLDASPETIASMAKKLCRADELIVLTGTGAVLLYPQLCSFYPSEYLRLNPQSRRGIAEELLKMAKRTIIEGESGVDSAPEYLRKSDAELNCP